MANTFKLEVITPERLFYEGDVEMVIVRTMVGYEGFLANHAWACKLLGTGIMRIKEPGQKDFKVAATTDGFIDVKDRVTIFVDAAEWPEEIDLERAQQKLEESQSRLKHGCCDEREMKLLKHSMEKAINRVKLKSGQIGKY